MVLLSLLIGLWKRVNYSLNSIGSWLGKNDWLFNCFSFGFFRQSRKYTSITWVVNLLLLYSALRGSLSHTPVFSPHQKPTFDLIDLGLDDDDDDDNYRHNHQAKVQTNKKGLLNTTTTMPLFALYLITYIYINREKIIFLYLIKPGAEIILSWSQEILNTWIAVTHSCTSWSVTAWNILSLDGDISCKHSTRNRQTDKSCDIHWKKQKAIEVFKILLWFQ